MKNYDWIIIGGGIAGISIAEYISRTNKNILLIEKNSKLCAETTAEFHEWTHAGSLYTLKNRDFMALNYLIKSINDLLKYYSHFENMNILPSKKGFSVKEIKNGWFQNSFIKFKFKISRRKINLVWLYKVARSILIINKIKTINWLDGYKNSSKELYPNFMQILFQIAKLLFHKDRFYILESPDLSCDSRRIITDLLDISIERGVEYSVDNEFINYKKTDEGIYEINSEKKIFYCKNLMFCNGRNISKVFSSQIKTTYSPMLVYKNLPKQVNHFVELDIFENNSINMIVKENNIGLFGGISFSNFENCFKYFNILRKKINIKFPNAECIHQYVGSKNELVPRNMSRNYLYNIWEKSNQNIFAIIPGKFSLFPSFCSEFSKKYHQKEIINNKIKSSNKINLNLISDTIWKKSFKEKI